MTPAQREAYARANTSLLNMETLEFRHPTFSAPVRIVNYQDPIDFPLEANAPVNAGETVEFIGLACTVKAADIDAQADAMVTVQIDGVSGVVQTLLAYANQSAVPIDVTVRFYSYNVKTGDVDGPVGIIHNQVRTIAVTKTTVAVAMGYTNSANKKFPSQIYTVTSNPGLSV